MNHKVLSALVSIAVSVTDAFCAVSAEAQTSAAGPYYAVPSWDQKLPSSTRFIVLSNWNNEAVLDRETGLVWERTLGGGISDWFVANSTCIVKTVGGRLGWHLPTIQELASLIDPSVAAPGPTLPAGHPFINVAAAGYWSSTSQAPAATQAWTVDFSSGFILGFREKGTTFRNVWCTRGGQTVDPQ